MNWEDCKKQVDKFPGAVYKSFTDYTSAKEYMFKTPVKSKNSGVYKAYVDGSYNANTKEYSGAYVLLKDGQVIKEFSKKYCDEASSMRNVAGEIAAAKLVIAYCLSANIKKLIIFHDYQGIAAWCTKEWKAKNRWTQEYADFYSAATRSMQITFEKVKGHSGDPFNDRADELAKLAFN